VTHAVSWLEISFCLHFG